MDGWMGVLRAPLSICEGSAGERVGRGCGGGVGV